MFSTFRSKLSLLALVIFFIILVWALIENFEQIRKGEKIDDLISLIVFGGLVLFLLFRWLKSKKIERAHYRESLAEGGIEEPGIFRDLTKDEKIWLLNISDKGNYYLDSRSPVFKVQGSAFKHVVSRDKDRRHLILKIRNIIFTEKSSPEVEKIFDFVKEGDEVAAEYSPRTKHIWKIYKTEDLK